MHDKCGAKTRSGTPCKSHGMENGRCRMHGGSATGRPIIHGRYSVKHRKKLQESIQKFLDDPKPGDLTAELALNRALLQSFLNRFPDDVKMSVKEMTIIYDMTEAIGKTVERITRMLNQSALTVAEVKLLEMTILDLLLRYIDDPQKRLNFMGEFRRLIGSANRADRSQASSGLSNQD